MYCMSIGMIIIQANSENSKQLLKIFMFRGVSAYNLNFFFTDFSYQKKQKELSVCSQTLYFQYM
jgi:hypothetical protein